MLDKTMNMEELIAQFNAIISERDRSMEELVETNRLLANENVCLRATLQRYHADKTISVDAELPATH